MQCNLNKPKATALIKGGNTAPAVIGTVEFYQKQNCVLVVANIRNLPQTDTGFFG